MHVSSTSLLCFVAGVFLTFIAVPPSRVSAEQIIHTAGKLKPAEAVECDAKNFKVAIDVGHTTEAPGAMSARGVAEFIFNKDLARQIYQSLLAAGFSHTTLITALGQGRYQLFQRVDRAHSAGVDLLLSIHHDDVQPKYYAEWSYGGRQHHFSDTFSGYSLFVSERNKHATESLEFATLLGAELVSDGMHFTSHHAENTSGENRQFLDPNLGVYRTTNSSC
jgi:N-acetylmuramoyl-L-alanine amidase